MKSSQQLQTKKKYHGLKESIRMTKSARKSNHIVLSNKKQEVL